MRDAAPGHGQVGRAPELHARGRVRNRRAEPVEERPGPRSEDDERIVRRPGWHDTVGDEQGAPHVRLAVRRARDAARVARPVRRRNHGIAVRRVSHAAPGPSERVCRGVRRPVRACKLDAGGHGLARPPVVPGHSAVRPPDAGHLLPEVGQRGGLRAHQPGPVVPGWHVPRRAQHVGVSQHAPFGGTGPASGTERSGDRRHSSAADQAPVTGKSVVSTDYCP